uniref:PARP-type domain-containing protein n=1 Tax=Panagrolaimus sp. ES5 TaxID=591445 RepID=A0AC34GGW3_9BILA
MWRVLQSETVHHCFFQYAVSGRSDCEGCKKKVEKKALRAKVENGTQYYHFECFWRYETTAKCKKDEIMIAVQRIQPGSVGYGNSRHFKTFENHPYVSLEILDQNLTGIKSLIQAEDLQRIREHVALAQDGKTQYYKPDIIKKQSYFCSYCNIRDNGVEPAEDYNLNGLR